jgi:transmembrane sensor
VDSEAVEAAAALWVIRRSGQSWTQADQQRLESWLELSTLHRVAYLRLSSVWQRTTHLKTLATGLPAGRVPPPGSWDTPALPTSAPEAIGDGPAQTLVRSERYATGVGGLRTVRLTDDSVVTLNTDTRIRTYLTPSERRIDLDSGEAHILATPDPARPFVVHVAGKTVTTDDTEFCVRRLAWDLHLLVVDGRAELRAARAGEPAPEMASMVNAGCLARTEHSTVLLRPVSADEARQLMSWRTGFLEFRNASLPHVIAELNRYQISKLVLDDPSLGTIKIGGRFRTTNLDGFLSLLQRRFPIAVDQSANRIALKRCT